MLGNVLNGLEAVLAGVVLSQRLCLEILEIDSAERCVPVVNSLTTKKQMTKFLSANFQKMLSPSCIILRIQRLEEKQRRS